MDGKIILTLSFLDEFLVSEHWKQNNIFHRRNAPAFFYWHNNILFLKKYYKKGALHNLFGPAKMSIRQTQPLIIHKEWYIDGVFYLEEDHILNKFKKEHNIDESYKKWTKEYKMLFRLSFLTN